MNEIRSLRREDLAELVALCREHAEYERAEWVEYERESRLAELFLREGAAHCWVVEGDGELAGFVASNMELSTWDAGRYMHLDCLYLREAYRGQGLGRELVERVAAAALELGAVNVQWQTPIWNEDAARFYARLRATHKEKLRFTLGRQECERLLNEED